MRYGPAALSLLSEPAATSAPPRRSGRPESDRAVGQEPPPIPAASSDDVLPISGREDETPTALRRDRRSGLSGIPARCFARAQSVPQPDDSGRSLRPLQPALPSIQQNASSVLLA